MFGGFELDINGWDISPYKQQGLNVFDYFKPKVERVLNEYLKDNKSLDGDKLREDWFPEVDADVFISHSHKDKDLAICLAGWLNHHFKIKSFIDSMIWGYADNLLRAIDDNYCKNQETGNYNYQLRNYSTSHIHVMLSASLNKMIDKTECFFFINTPNSISTKQAIEDPKTFSPWIYSEIEISRLIKKRTRKWHREYNGKLLHESLTIEHSLDTDHLHKLNKNDFELWEKQLGPYKLMSMAINYPLDLLYTNVFIKNNIL
jgi:hypothetical protein